MDTYSLMADAAKVIPNRFLLTKIATDRIRELQRGSKPKVDVEEKTPLMQIALKEIAENKIELVGFEESEAS